MVWGHSSSYLWGYTLQTSTSLNRRWTCSFHWSVCAHIGEEAVARGLALLLKGKGLFVWNLSGVGSLPAVPVISAEVMGRLVERGRSRNDRGLSEEPRWTVLVQPCDNLSLRKQLKLFASGHRCPKPCGLDFFIQPADFCSASLGRNFQWNLS